MTTAKQTNSVGELAEMLNLCKLHGFTPAHVRAGDCEMTLIVPTAPVGNMTVSRDDGARLFAKFGGPLMNDKQPPGEDIVSEETED